MSVVYDFKDIISLALSLSFFAKIQLFRNREKYEKGLLTEESTFICDSRQIYVKVDDFSEVLNSSDFSDAHKEEISSKASKLPTQTINTDECVGITTISQLRALF